MLTVSLLRSLLRRLFVVLALLLASAQAGNFTLVYHEVGKGQHGTLGIEPADLEQRVQTLRRLGYRFVTSSQIRASADKTAVLEFDDGFESVYTQAFPLLKRLGIPGSAYPILSLIGTPGHMTQLQLAELRAAGWEVGSHTLHHADLTSLTPASLRAELSPVGVVGANKVCVAYPFSLFDTRTRREARKVYACGVGGGQGNWGGKYSLPGPQITPWDGWLLPYRAPAGLDGRAPLLAAGAAVIASDFVKAATSKSIGVTGDGAAYGQPRFWNPARYELLGRGDYQAGLTPGGGHYGLLAQRQNGFVLGIEGGAVTSGGASGHQGALILAYNIPKIPLTLAAGVGAMNAHPQAIVGASVGLGGYGEGWVRSVFGPANSQVAAGLEVIPLDYLRLKAEYTSGTGAALEGIYALPLDVGEGRPYRVLAGYNPQQRWYLGGLWQLGSYSLRAAVGKGFSVGFESRW